MKKLITLFFISISLLIKAQVPQGINYQSVIRNTTGIVLPNTPVTVDFKLYDGSTIVYAENHAPTTNGFGMVNLIIGQGSATTGVFSTIDWSKQIAYEVYVNSNLIGTKQNFMSVPYALRAASAPAPSVSFTNNVLSVGGNTTTIPAGTNYVGGTGISVVGNTIINTATNVPVSITGAGTSSVSGSYPNFIITSSSPTVQTYSAGNGINIDGAGVISNTAVAAATPTININAPNAVSNPSSGIYNITVPPSTPYTLTANSNTITLDNGTSVSSAIVPTAAFYTLTSSSNTLTLDNGTSISTATIPVSSSYTLSSISNSITLDNGTSVSTVTVPTAPLYTLSANSNSITLDNGTSVSTVTVPTAPIYTLSSNSNTITLDNGTSVSSATLPVYSAGNGINISTTGVITNTASSINLPSAYNGQFLYYNQTQAKWDTIPQNRFFYDETNNMFGIGTKSPSSDFHVNGAGRFNSSITTTQIYANNMQLTTGTFTNSGDVLINDGLGNGTWQTLPAPALNYNSGTSVLSLNQGTTVSTVTLTGTGSNTVSMVGSGLASVTPTTGSNFTVTVPNPTLSIASGSLSISNGNSVAIPSPSLSINSNSLTINGPGGNTVLLPANTVAGIGTGVATVTTAANNFTVNVPNPNLSLNSNSLSINGGNTVVLPTSATTTLTQGPNVTVSGPVSNYTVSAPAYSITLPGGNVAQISNGVSTSTAAISPTNLTLNGVNNNILSAGGNTVGLNTYTAGTGISITGSAPNYVINNTMPAAVTQTLTGTGISSVTPGANTFTVNTPMPTYTQTTGILSFGGTNTVVATPSLSILGNVVRSGPVTNTITLPLATITGTGTGIANVIAAVNAFTVNVPTPGYDATTGALSFGANTVIVTPTLSLSGTTLTSGPATNSVSLSGLNGIYGGSGSIQTGSTTVTVGTNTLTFLSGTTANKPIANFFGGGITGTHLAIGHIGANNAALRLLGSVNTTPVDYGYILGSANGISISGGTSTNGFYATNNAEVGVGAFTTGNGKFVITHTASQAEPTMHLRETAGGLNRIKFSNNTVASKYFETAAQTNAVDGNGAYSINYFDGATYKPVVLVTGERKVNINNLNTVLGSFHVMENSTTAGGGIISEGFNQSAQLNLARNNQPALAARLAVLNGDEIGKINFAGYDGTSFGDGAKIYAKAAENVSGLSKGTELIFAAVPTGTNSNRDVFKINAANKLEVITSMIIPFNAGVGKVLTSDPSGNASWQAASASSWGLTGNAGTVDGTNFIGTTDNVPLTLKVNNIRAGRIDNSKSSAFYGMNAGTLLTSGTLNSGFGDAALYQITTGTQNSAVGAYALYFNNTGNYNTALGAYGLNSNTSGSNNTTTGARSMFNNSNGFDNAANGFEALYSNTTGYQNTASGSQSLRSNIGGYSNSAFGIQTLFSNTTGSENQAFGFRALYNNTTGYQNSATGSGAMFNNTTGYANTADGKLALYGNTTGIQNVGVGYYAGKTNQIGDNNTFIGHQSDASVNNLINAMAIGANATVTASNKVQIGNASITHVQLGTASTATLETGLVKITGGSPGAGKVLTSDPAGLASWQPGPAASPWIQGAGIVTQNINGDNVGIGIASPSSPLHVVNTNSTSIGARFESNNAASTYANVASITNGSGAAVQASNSGTGNAGYFFTTNPANSSPALNVSTNGLGTSIYASNSNTANTSAVIQAYQVSSGVALYASNSNTTGGGTAQFDGNSNFSTFSAINYSGGQAIVSQAQTGNAIYASNNSGSNATIYTNNTGTGDVIQATAGQGRSIFASNNSTSGYAALEATNNGSGNTISAYKSAATTGGIVGSFINNSTSNGADAIFAQTNGTGVAIHAVSGPTVAGSSNVALLVESGHIKSTQSALPFVTANPAFVVGTALTNFNTYSITLDPKSTDTKGTIKLSTSSNISVGGAGTGDYRINFQFNKSYSDTPTVIISPANSMLPVSAQNLIFSYFVDNTSATGFDLHVTYKSLGAVGAVLITPINFNYFIIE